MAFLDCLVKISDKRKLNTIVYRKPTHTDHYLQFDSHHPLIHKLGVIRALYHRAGTIISDQDDVAPEKDHIKGALYKCDYPNWAFEQAKRTKADKTPKDLGGTNPSETTKKTLIKIPYCAGVSERVKKIYRLFDIAIGFKPVSKLCGQLVHVKDKPQKDKKSNLVYGYKCAEPGCSESYIGDTKQSLKARIE